MSAPQYPGEPARFFHASPEWDLQDHRSAKPIFRDYGEPLQGPRLELGSGVRRKSCAASGS
eukprot:15804096-Heterocapsa_arctica.AAC.1